MDNADLLQLITKHSPGSLAHQASSFLWRDIRGVGKEMLQGRDDRDMFAFDMKLLRSVLCLKLKGSFFARRCCKEVCAIVESSDTGEENFLVIGSPGIGKSFCLLYFLARLSSKKNVIVLLNNLLGKSYVFCSNLDASIRLGDSENLDELLASFARRGLEVCHLFDAGAKGDKTTPITIVADVKLVVAASPDLANYNQRLKDDPQMIFVEPWRFRELAQLNCSLSSSLSHEELQKRCALVGGAPRTFFSAHSIVVKGICAAARNLKSSDVKRVLSDAQEGFARSADAAVSRKVCQMAPINERAECRVIPAGMLAACRIRAMAAIRQDSDFQDLFIALGMVKSAGPFAGRAFEAYARMIAETGHKGAIADSAFLSSNAPNCHSAWKKDATKWLQIKSFRGSSELEGQLKISPNSYWKAAKPDFPAIDGLILSEDADRARMHFLQITTSKSGKSSAVSSKSLQDYVNCLLEGWEGDESNLVVCLWLALPAALHDEKSGPHAREQKLSMSVKPQQRQTKTKKRKLTHARNRDGPERCRREINKPILQGKVRFDWSAVNKQAPIEVMAELWWRQNREQFPKLLAEYEALYLDANSVE